MMIPAGGRETAERHGRRHAKEREKERGREREARGRIEGSSGGKQREKGPRERRMIPAIWRTARALAEKKGGSRDSIISSPRHEHFVVGCILKAYKSARPWKGRGLRRWSRRIRCEKNVTLGSPVSASNLSREVKGQAGKRSERGCVRKSERGGAGDKNGNAKRKAKKGGEKK